VLPAPPTEESDGEWEVDESSTDGNAGLHATNGDEDVLLLEEDQEYALLDSLYVHGLQKDEAHLKKVFAELLSGFERHGQEQLAAAVCRVLQVDRLEPYCARRPEERFDAQRLREDNQKLAQKFYPKMPEKDRARIKLPNHFVLWRELPADAVRERIYKEDYAVQERTVEAHRWRLEDYQRMRDDDASERSRQEGLRTVEAVAARMRPNYAPSAASEAAAPQGGSEPPAAADEDSEQVLAFKRRLQDIWAELVKDKAVWEAHAYHDHIFGRLPWGEQVVKKLPPMDFGQLLWEAVVRVREQFPEFPAALLDRFLPLPDPGEHQRRRQRLEYWKNRRAAGPCPF
jgi:hypothetical protein